MPTTLPGSFASAAAGNNTDASSRSSGRGDSGGFGDWSRRPNGATQTFRRSSTAATSHTHQRESSSSNAGTNSPAVGTYLPPHMNTGRNGSASETRYSKPQLLELFKEQRELGDLENGLSDLYVGEWADGFLNGTSGAKWTKREEMKTDNALPGPEACWERGGGVEPLGLAEMTEEEKELFSTSVNSPLKSLNQSTMRDGSQKEGAMPRKTSISQSHGSSHGHGIVSPTVSRPGKARRETSESYALSRDTLTSPTEANKQGREESSNAPTPFGLFRRKTEHQEGVADASTQEVGKENAEVASAGSGMPFGSFKRSVTNPVGAGFNAPASPWSATPQTASMSPMGAFGNFGLTGASTQPANATGKKLDPITSRESRFRGLMNKTGTDDESEGLQERPSMSSLPRPEENDLQRQMTSHFEHPSDQAVVEEVDAHQAEPMSFGSAALGGRNDDSPGPQARLPGFGTPDHRKFVDEQGFSPFGMGSDPTAFRGLGEPPSRDVQQGQPFSAFERAGEGPQDPTSPTFTNPYASPQQPLTGLRDTEPEELEMGNLHLPGLGGYQPLGMQEPIIGSFNARRDANRLGGYDSRVQDRSQTSSAGPSRAFPSLGGFGGLAGLGNPEAWTPTHAPGYGTPIRERPPFAEFSEQSTRSPAAAQSPGLGGPQGSNAFGAPGSTALAGPGTIGRGSKLGSLFPAAMQEQMRNDYTRQAKDEESYPSGPEGYEELTRIGTARRDGESPFRPAGRGKFDDFFTNVDRQQAFRDADQQFAGEPSGLTPNQLPLQPSNYSNQAQQQPPQQGGQHMAALGGAASNQPPAAQQKTMVMPDRIRWIYRDPQGNTQGPWSGLEMHDWYRAGFFSPELLVKKVEDGDYEPLAQLIRRIGNSREPFLVPQIGIPGPPSSQSGTWPSQTASTAAPGAGAAQPPFAGSFPSFGTTLTADQQNALERRKQEEQYLMARQKEHLAQQQVLVRQLQTQQSMHPQQLQHHSSAQSLHSQPSYGSMTSPGNFQTSPPQGINQLNPGMQGNFDTSHRASAGAGLGTIGSGVDNLERIREEDPSSMFGRLDLEQRSQVAGGLQQPLSRFAQQDARSFEDRTAAILADRARLEAEQAENDASFRGQEQDLSSADRLREFQELRNAMDSEEYAEQTSDLLGSRADFQEAFLLQAQPRYVDPAYLELPEESREEHIPQEFEPEGGQVASKSLSLTEQVQKAASSKQAPGTSPWAKIDTVAVEEVPPLPSQSPLPAPAARRGRHNVADALAEESISQSQSPSVETPSSSLAPWAREHSETQKQPSLREIQEAEARRAAKQEEIAAAARRAALEKEIANQPAPPGPGLPSSSTWGSAESPITPSSVSTSAWTKPAAVKAAAVPAGTAKKSLQQIQLEEEAAARKKKTAATTSTSVTAAATSAAQTLSSGKRYADLAGKAASPSPVSTGAWTTVGASGKAKAPPTAATGPVSTSRTTSSGNVPSAAAATRPKPVSANSKTSLATAQQTAQDEFKKWAVSELRPDLNKDIHVEEFVQTLLNFPSDTDMITEVVHQNSRTIDSRHFAEEFVRRRGLAEKGKMDASAASSGAAHHNQASEAKGGGWSEVARKGSGTATGSQQKDEGNGAFKIVAAKKKGSKK